MSAQNAERRPGPGAAIQQNDTTSVRGQRSADQALPKVSAAVYPPSGRRGLPLLVVATCPYCPTGGHAHRCSATGDVRESGCRRGSYYVVPRPVLVQAPRRRRSA